MRERLRVQTEDGFPMRLYVVRSEEREIIGLALTESGARLIAAAIDLLAACEQFLAVIAEKPASTTTEAFARNWTASELDAAIGMAKEAVSKAKGE